MAYSSPIQRAVGRSQGLGAPAPQPVGASGQLGKEQALPCAENLLSRCGVRLGEYDGTPHGGTCPSSAELPEFLQRQECGTTETVSEAPGAYGIRSCSHAAQIASYETTSALATLPGPEVGMAPRYTASRYLPAVSPLPQPLDRPCLSTGRGAPRTSVPAYCCHNRCLQHGLGRYMQRAGSLGALDRAPTALAHQLPGAVGSAFSLAAVPANAVRQARASPHGQHCGGLVYQPAGGIRSHRMSQLARHLIMRVLKGARNLTMRSCFVCRNSGYIHFQGPPGVLPPPMRWRTVPLWQTSAELRAGRHRTPSQDSTIFALSQFLPVYWVSNGREELAGVTLAAPFPLTRGYERLFLPQFSSLDGEPWWNPPSTPGSQTGRSSLTPGPVLVLARPGLRSAPVLG